MTAVLEVSKRTPMRGADVVEGTRHRLGQAWSHVAQRRDDVTIPPDVAPLLKDEIAPRFHQLSPADRHHLIGVATVLQATGWDADVGAAGLLHDIGKGDHIHLIDRGLWVMMRRFSPSLATRIASSSTPPRIGRGLWVLAHHARIGSEILAEAGYSERTCRLVRHHEDTVTSDPGLRALMAADDGRPAPSVGQHA